MVERDVRVQEIMASHSLEECAKDARAPTWYQAKPCDLKKDRMVNGISVECVTIYDNLEDIMWPTIGWLITADSVAKSLPYYRLHPSTAKDRLLVSAHDIGGADVEGHFKSPCWVFLLYFQHSRRRSCPW